jgi:hypothetical protein
MTGRSPSELALNDSRRGHARANQPCFTVLAKPRWDVRHIPAAPRPTRACSHFSRLGGTRRWFVAGFECQPRRRCGPLRPFSSVVADHRRSGRASRVGFVPDHGRLLTDDVIGGLRKPGRGSFSDKRRRRPRRAADKSTQPDTRSCPTRKRIQPRYWRASRPCRRSSSQLYS